MFTLIISVSYITLCCLLCFSNRVALYFVLIFAHVWYVLISVNVSLCLPDVHANQTSNLTYTLSFFKQLRPDFFISLMTAIYIEAINRSAGYIYTFVISVYGFYLNRQRHWLSRPIAYLEFFIRWPSVSI